MKRITLIIAGIAILFLCSTCRKEHVAPVNPLVKDLFCFKEGSEWTYYDSVSQTTQRMVVTKYETTRIGSKYAMRKTKDWEEIIKMQISIENVMQSFFANGQTCFGAEVDQDNTAEGGIFTPANTTFSIRCDANNNFVQGVYNTTQTISYLSTYTVNGTTYSDVYVFNIIENIIGGTYKDDFTYYVSKHVGFIRCVRQCEYPKYFNFDLVLINKKIQQ